MRFGNIVISLAECVPMCWSLPVPGWPGHMSRDVWLVQESDCFSVQLDAEIAAMMRPGMMLEGSFGLLSDGTWYLGQPCQIWPSFRRSPGSSSPVPQR